MKESTHQKALPQMKRKNRLLPILCETENID